MCVEVAFLPQVVLIRDGKDPEGPVLTVDHDTWTQLITALKSGQFDY